MAAWQPLSIARRCKTGIPVELSPEARTSVGNSLWAASAIAQELPGTCRRKHSPHSLPAQCRCRTQRCRCCGFRYAGGRGAAGNPTSSFSNPRDPNRQIRDRPGLSWFPGALSEAAAALCDDLNLDRYSPLEVAPSFVEEELRIRHLRFRQEAESDHDLGAYPIHGCLGQRQRSRIRRFPFRASARSPRRMSPIVLLPVAGSVPRDQDEQASQATQTKSKPWAHCHDVAEVMSHRSGETEDSLVADLAARLVHASRKSDRCPDPTDLSKYNRLMEIEAEPGSREIGNRFITFEATNTHRTRLCAHGAAVRVVHRSTGGTQRGGPNANATRQRFSRALISALNVPPRATSADAPKSTGVNKNMNPPGRRRRSQEGLPLPAGGSHATQTSYQWKCRRRVQQPTTRWGVPCASPTL